MIRTLTWWELTLAAALLLLAGSEWIGLWLARRRGLTANVSRLVSHGIVLALVLAYAIYAATWTRGLEGGDLALRLRELPTVNWTYVILGLIAAVMVSWDLVALVHARSRGLTTNVSRMVSHLAMLIILVVMVGISVLKWDLYLDRVAETYREGIQRSR
ncbi:MAG TPA: hypothetical protein VMT16_11330 [Thermoanaerobaculia bacterium]|nr:hypothetical protein [Thermoanaerobaculia bacterium]